MEKYRDLPMDLADASLVICAEEIDDGRILSTDQRDVGAYRFERRKPFRNLLQVRGVAARCTPETFRRGPRGDRAPAPRLRERASVRGVELPTGSVRG